MKKCDWKSRQVDGENGNEQPQLQWQSCGLVPDYIAMMCRHCSSKCPVSKDLSCAAGLIPPNGL